MRILVGEELQEAEKWMNAAVGLAMQSPCQKDKRGVVIVKNNLILGKAFNAPPRGFACEQKYCHPTCKNYAGHAEIRAIADATQKGNGNELTGARMYHARAEAGVLQDSRKPRCFDCCRYLAEFGIGDFVLKHAEGYTVYPIEEFSRISFANSLKR